MEEDIIAAAVAAAVTTALGVAEDTIAALGVVEDIIAAQGKNIQCIF